MKLNIDDSIDSNPTETIQRLNISFLMIPQSRIHSAESPFCLWKIQLRKMTILQGVNEDGQV